MKKKFTITIAFCLGLFVGCTADKRADFIVACGEDKVLVIDAKSSDGGQVNIVRRWQVTDSAAQLPVAYQQYLPPINDCKPVDGNTKILLTGGSAVVLLERETGKCLFYARTPNSHSADWLPDNKVVVALSIAEGGNSLEVYDIRRPEQVLFRDSLYSGHGAVWIPERERFYALGFDELREYSLKNWNTASPELRLEKRWILPEEDGHDLSPVSGGKLMVTASKGVYLFDIMRETFTPFEPLKGIPGVKSVNYNEATGQLIYTKAEESWWTFNIYMKHPDRKLTLPDVRLYKVRLIYNL
ncbi:MAG: DUF6528 family protein [Tannerella sp.]|jgi:hypothetical protein|nr:DUF6528 family protein [Tannerella sp.]